MGSLLRRVMEAVATDVTAEIAGRRCLVLAPHPDDEVLGCGGVIARKVKQGAHVSVAFLTDGRHGFSTPADDARTLREQEAMVAAAALGLPAEVLVFFGFEDGRLNEHVEEATESVRRMVDTLQVDDLFVPYKREYHADHQAAWRIGMACRRSGTRLYEYPVWYGPWLWDRLGWKARMAAAMHVLDGIHAVKVGIAEVLGIKQRALSAYRSQVSGFEERGPWGKEFLANFLGNFELFFVRQW